MGQVHIARSAPFGDLCAQVHLGFYGSAGIQHVGHLQQSQLGDADAGRVSLVSNYVPSIDTAKSPVIPTYDAISATPH